MAAEMRAGDVTRVISPTSPFTEILTAFEQFKEQKQASAKFELEHVVRSLRKKTEAEWAAVIEQIDAAITVAKEAIWLYEKFGEGEYQDVPGLCEIAFTTKEAQGEDKDGINIEEKGWSLTPGAYVGVAPTQDDGVDFAQRMKEIHAELLALQAESNALMETISKNMEEMGL
jgi:type I restriction enzyme M protein